MAARHGLKVVRCRGNPDPWRVAAGLPRLQGRSTGQRRRGRPAGARRAAWLQRHRDLRTLRRAGEAHQAPVAVAAHRTQEREQEHLRVRRAGQRQHAAELLRHRPGFPRLHRGPQSLQARAASRQACMSRSARSRRSTRSSPITSSSCPGTCKDEIVQQMRHVADWGGKFIVPIPEPTIIDPKDFRS